MGPFDKLNPVPSLDIPEIIEETNVVQELIVDEEPIAIIETTEVKVETPVEPVEDKPKYHYKQQYTIQDFPHNLEKSADQSEQISLPSYFREATENFLKDLPNANIAVSEHARDWATVLQEGMSYLPNSLSFKSTLIDPEVEFHNTVKHNGSDIITKPPRYKNVENSSLQGEIAVMRVISQLGLGSLMQVPLWHSGIWVTFKPAGESEIVELYRRLVKRKIEFGRFTSGLIYSNIGVYFTNELVDFAIAHIYDLSTKSPDITIENIKDHIVSQDIPSLIWGMVSSIYPKGFRYRRACNADALKCNHIVEATLDVSKLQWTNTKGLTEWQKAFMYSRQAKFRTLEEIQRYKSELRLMQKHRFSLDDNSEIFFTVKNPSLSEYIDSGHRWIGEIVSAVEAVLEIEATDQQREEEITRRGQATTLRQYVHWVDSIEVGSNVINDRATIESTLDHLSSDDVIRNKILSSIVDYINRSTISLIGIPVYTCPACGKTQEFEQTDTGLQNFTNIIPLDVGLVFFGLIVQRMSKIRVR